MKFSNYLLLLLAFLAACKEDSATKMIVGKWQGYEWLFQGKPAPMDASKLHFNFKEDGTVEGNFDQQGLSGTWRMEKGKIFLTQPKKPIMEIVVLKADGVTLEFEMDIRGNKEVMKFKKESP